MVKKKKPRKSATKKRPKPTPSKELLDNVEWELDFNLDDEEVPF